MKIKKLLQENLIVKFTTPDRLKKVNGLIVQPGKTVHLVGTVVDVGANVKEPINIGDKVLVHAQSLDYRVDSPELTDIIEDKGNEYFVLFESHILAILEDEQHNV